MKQHLSVNSSLIILFLIAILTPSVGQVPDSKLKTTLQQKIDSLRNDLQIPAMAFSCVLPSGEQIAVASGMQAESRMLAGSTGKTFFASLALRLMHEKRLALDDKVSRYLGEKIWYRQVPNAEAVTVRMLMEHTSGIQEYYERGDFTKQLRENPDSMWTPEACIGYVLGLDPLFPAGNGWSYADTNYLLLGLVLEEILHTKAYDEINRYFIQPYKLSSTEPSLKRHYNNFVHGITTPNNPFGLKEQMVINDSLVINPQMEWAGGGFVSNTVDLARWAKIYYQGKGISEELLQTQRKGVAARTGKDHRYGLGMQIRPSLLGMSYGHGGWFPGYLTEMDYFPDRDLAVSIQIATDDFQKLKHGPRFFEMFFAEVVAKHL